MTEHPASVEVSVDAHGTYVYLKASDDQTLRCWLLHRGDELKISNLHIAPQYETELTPARPEPPPKTCPYLKVVTLNEMTLRDCAGQLRRLADRIEANEFGGVTTCGVVLMGDMFEAFGWGDGINHNDASTSVALMFSAGHLRVAKAIEEHGRK